MKIRVHHSGIFGIIALTSLFAAIQCDAKVINAASCGFADVSAAVAQASPGDVVQLPAGSSSWTQSLTLNGVSLIGAGTNSTIIIDEESRSSSAQIINLYPQAGTYMEIANIQFEGGVTNTSANYTGCLAVYGATGASWRIDHNIFNGLYGKNIVTYGDSTSVIDHNAFYEKYISVCCYGYIWPGDGNGDVSWSMPATYGLASSNCLYVENNYFTNMTTWLGSVGATDGNGGGRIVFRDNIIMNDVFNDHGTESGGRVRSLRSFEVYNNTFTCPPSATSLYPIYTACMIRGGSGLIFSNTINGYSSVAAIRNYRFTCSYYNEFDPFGGANGLSPYDSNDPTLYLTGTSSGPSGSAYLQVNGVNWTPNQWVGYTVIDTSNGNFSEINSNTVNTIYYIGSTPDTASVIPCTVLTFNPGDVFQIRRVYASLDQPGRGSGDLLQDVNNSWLTSSNHVLVTLDTATETESWPNQALDGIYSWANNLNGLDGQLASAYPGVAVGRELYNDTPKPGYTPYVYPHPLTYMYVGSTNLTGGPGNNPTNNPPPVTNNPTTNGLTPPPNFHIIH
ncbi:MAG TPA: hypothetical protein VNV43_03840 [Candidatus Acidoferrales bacterium]|nr:hypothetical protein [Candidatus Acidoferrales bacterium]